MGARLEVDGEDAASFSSPSMAKVSSGRDSVGRDMVLELLSCEMVVSLEIYTYLSVLQVYYCVNSDVREIRRILGFMSM